MRARTLKWWKVTKMLHKFARFHILLSFTVWMLREACSDENCFRNLSVLSEEWLWITVYIVIPCLRSSTSSRAWCSPTCGCTVVQQDLPEWKSPFPYDELVKGACYIVIVRPVVARSNDKVRVGVTVELWDAATCSITSSECPIDVDLQPIRFSPCEENVGPEWPWKRKQLHVE